MTGARVPGRAVLGRLALGVVAGALTGACAETLPLAPTPAGARPTVAHMRALACTFDLGTRSLGCAPTTADTAARATAPTPARDLVIGGAHGADTLVRLTATAPAISGQTVTVPVSVTNLLSQPMGTADGATYDGVGVTVFFQTAPTMATGAGTGQPVYVSNPDGVGTFTASGQPYFTYAQLLTGNETSAPRAWTFTLPPTANPAADRFSFTAYVQARLADETTPVVVLPHAFDAMAAADGRAAGLAAAGYFTCGRRPGAGVYCWGFTSPVLGYNPTAGDRTRPWLVPGTQHFRQLTAEGESYHTCALTDAGAAYCWGYNFFGELGDGTTTDRIAPTAVPAPAGARFTALSAGGYHTCGLTTAGAAYCWGLNYRGEVGDGTTTNQSAPTAVGTPAGVTFVALTVGGAHTCGLTAAGAAYCWGDNGNGQVGDGTATNRTAPTPLTVPDGVGYVALTAGNEHTCGLTPAGAAYCWGRNQRGQLGDSTTTNRGTPTRVAAPPGVAFVALTAGGNHTCGRTRTGAAYCWGANESGELGDGTAADRLAPTAVAAPPGVAFAALSAGSVHSCGLTGAGAAYCWGDNGTGEIGDGTTTQRLTPTPVVMP